MLLCVCLFSHVNIYAHTGKEGKDTESHIVAYETFSFSSANLQYLDEKTCFIKIRTETIARDSTSLIIADSIVINSESSENILINNIKIENDDVFTKVIINECSDFLKNHYNLRLYYRDYLPSALRPGYSYLIVPGEGVNTCSILCDNELVTFNPGTLIKSGKHKIQIFDNGKTIIKDSIFLENGLLYSLDFKKPPNMIWQTALAIAGGIWGPLHIASGILLYNTHVDPSGIDYENADLGQRLFFPIFLAQDCLSVGLPIFGVINMVVGSIVTAGSGAASYYIYSTKTKYSESEKIWFPVIK